MSKPNSSKPPSTGDDLTPFPDRTGTPARAHNTRGIARFQRGDVAGAVADFDAALQLDPDCPSETFRAALPSILNRLRQLRDQR